MKDFCTTCLVPVCPICKSHKVVSPGKFCAEHAAMIKRRPEVSIVYARFIVAVHGGVVAPEQLKLRLENVARMHSARNLEGDVEVELDESVEDTHEPSTEQPS